MDGQVSKHIKNEWEIIQEGYSSFFKTDSINLEKSYYRFMSEESFDYILKGQFRFNNPIRWKDPFEKIMVEGDYNKLEYKKPATYAACFTKLSNSEAHWRMYTNEKQICVRVEFDMENFIGALMLGGAEQFFIGNVSYDLLERSIKAIGSKRSKYHKIAIPENFMDNDYVDLLLLKRPAFKWEEETRIVILNKDKQNDFCNLSYNSEMAKTFIKSIQISPLTSDEEVERLRNKYFDIWQKLEGRGYDFDFSKSKLYNPIKPIVFEK